MSAIILPATVPRSSDQPLASIYVAEIFYDRRPVINLLHNSAELLAFGLAEQLGSMDTYSLIRYSDSHWKCLREIYPDAQILIQRDFDDLVEKFRFYVGQTD
jgi:hypothetical protein